MSTGGLEQPEQHEWAPCIKHCLLSTPLTLEIPEITAFLREVLFSCICSLPAGDVEGDGVGQLGVGHVLDAEQLHHLLPDGLQQSDLADAGRVPLPEHQDDDVEVLLDQRRDLSIRSFLSIF